MKNTQPSNRISHRRIAAAGVNLHVAQCGNGPSVLLLHGFPDHWRLWEPTMHALANAHHTMAPDLRGYNLSDKPASLEDYRIDCLVQDVRALIAELGGRCALVGHDWGGMLAWTVAARYPAEVSRLVILNAPHPCRFAQQLRADPAQRSASDYVRRLCAPEVELELAKNNYARLWGMLSKSTKVSLDAAEQTASIDAWAQPGALHAMLNWYRAMSFDAALASESVATVPDLGGASGKVEAPTLVIWGEQDGSFPVACLNQLEDWVPKLTVHREPNGGHWLVREQPALVAELITHFLK